MTDTTTAPEQRAVGQAVGAWLDDFNAALAAGDAAAAADLFATACFWRDLVSLTWNITTVERPAGVRDLLEQTLQSAQPHDFRVCEAPSEAEGVIIGGGQGGIALAARLRQLDVPTIVADRHPRPGDQWRSRYKSLCLHDPVWYYHLPYIKFPENWPVFSPKDKIADQIPLYDQMRERDRDFYDRLEKAGFDHDWGEDNSGLFMKYLRRGSGYYIDVGAADLVADGRVKLARGQVDHLTEHAVVLADGTELPADLVVYATGYGSMNGWAADLISQEVADRVGKVGAWARTPPRTPGHGRASSATCGSPPNNPACGFTEATCTSHATTPCTWRCSSRRGRSAFPRRSTDSRRSTTPAEVERVAGGRA